MVTLNPKIFDANVEQAPIRKHILQSIVTDAKIFSILLLVVSFAVSLFAHIFAPYVEGHPTFSSEIRSVSLLLPKFAVIALCLFGAWSISVKNNRLSAASIFLYLAALILMVHEFFHHLAYILYYSPLLERA